MSSYGRGEQGWVPGMNTEERVENGIAGAAGGAKTGMLAGAGIGGILNGPPGMVVGGIKGAAEGGLAGFATGFLMDPTRTPDQAYAAGEAIGAWAVLLGPQLLPAMAACAATVYGLNLKKYIGADRDDLAHCITSCELITVCKIPEGLVELSGSLWEKATGEDLIDSARDETNNKTGMDCAFTSNTSENCSCTCCCEKQLGKL